VQHPPQSWTGYGVYLGQGLVITAAHVVGSARRTRPIVQIANLELPATAIKEGTFEQVDLTLLAIEQERLPVSLRLRRMPLCQTPPWVSEPVIVAVPEGIARSTIMSPRSLPASTRMKFPTVISDVATTGNSGSGVFDARRKCLLGIMSRKIVNRQNNSIVAKQKDIAKYFVPAATIAAFIPNGYRY
jgi:Trypsin-like peptidase domain